MSSPMPQRIRTLPIHRSDDSTPPLPSGDPYIGEYHIYACPGCATQLQVDMFSPSLGGDALLWDTRIDADKVKIR